jgi:Holliday junction resolvase RusA-like endonuclease
VSLRAGRHRRALLEIDVAGLDPADGSINLYLRSTRKQGGHFKPARLLAFRRALADAWRADALTRGVSLPLVACELRLDVELAFPRRSSALGPRGVLAFGDVDAPVKAIIDSLADAGAILDDVLVVELGVRKRWAQGSPGVACRLARK